jgi:membrane-anchored protein YejM (alkaline phosphatase superfamily)
VGSAATRVEWWSECEWSVGSAARSFSIHSLLTWRFFAYFSLGLLLSFRVIKVVGVVRVIGVTRVSFVTITLYGFLCLFTYYYAHKLLT